jgi:hypothetical protein
MNTNSKHYELLAIEPWDIMEANFPPEQFVAYLKGNIIKYTLRDKGQALTDAQKIKHYAEKLIEVLETQENDKDNWTITGVKPEEVEDKPMIVKDSKFKVGDRVIVNDTSIHKKMIGTVIREPRDKQNGTEYLIELDEKEKLGWKATIAYHSVESERAWYTVEADLELLEEEPKKTLEPNKWYNAKDFTVEELKELLPVGTVVIVTEKPDGNSMVNLPYERLLSTTVSNIGRNELKNSTRVGISADIWWRRYFKIEG